MEALPSSGYVIERVGLRRLKRLVTHAVLSSADFDAIATEIRQVPKKVRKIGLIAACRTQEAREIATRWNGEETRNTAKPGDWIVTNLSPRGDVLRDASGSQNTYVITADQFDQIYTRAIGENEFGPIFKARGVVEALKFPGGFDILAPWKERQLANSGYILRNGNEIYGNERQTFEATYEAVD